ncbi:MAG: hypothetical protein JWM04_207 [Verrucomicrobiales bacterium]|nr:hypothetical protein [Verrucomicrobiales bacterium]
MSPTLKNKANQIHPTRNSTLSTRNHSMNFKPKTLKGPMLGDSLWSPESLPGGQKMSPSVMGDNPVLLSKCRFPVTFLSISKSDIRSPSKHPLPMIGSRISTRTSAQNRKQFPRPEILKVWFADEALGRWRYPQASAPEEGNEVMDQNLNISQCHFFVTEQKEPIQSKSPCKTQTQEIYEES